MTEQVLGRVAGLWRYPVKSMAGEPLETAEVDWHGLAGDRRWAFVQDDLVRSNFPWLTIRERAEMAHFRPLFEDPERPEASRTLVRTPSGEEIDVADPALGDRLGGGVRVIKQNRGTFDTMSALADRRPVDRDARRTGRHDARGAALPADVLVDADAFAEDEWVGSTLRIGSMRVRVDQRDQRCVMVNVDPDTTERDPRVLRTIAQERDTCLGVYGTIVEPGRIALGDPIVLDG